MLEKYRMAMAAHVTDTLESLRTLSYKVYFGAKTNEEEYERNDKFLKPRKTKVYWLEASEPENEVDFLEKQDTDSESEESESDEEIELSYVERTKGRRDGEKPSSGGKRFGRSNQRSAKRSVERGNSDKRSKDRKEDKATAIDTKAKTKARCFNCQKEGHIFRDCEKPHI